MNELTLQLRMSGKEHLYEQIYTFIKQEIKGGKLLKNEKLPSTRALAEHLQVSRSTVDLAYEQLASEGYIEARPCSGYFVCEIEELYTLEELPKTEKRSKEEQRNAYQVDFALNQLEKDAFPIATWKSISRNVLLNHSEKLFGLGPAKGEPALRQTISRYLHASRGVNCREEQIIIGAGNDYLLILLEKILGRSVKIGMEDPSYRRAFQAFQASKDEIVTISMDKNGMCVEDLDREDVEIAYVMPAHQFPMGVVMPIGRRTELLNWAARRENRYIIEDDYDSEFRYKGKPIPALQASDRHQKVIYIGTFSKSIAPAIRVSYMVLPEPLLAAYEKNAQFLASTVSRTDQEIITEFMKGGYFERHLNKMRKCYKTKHDSLLMQLRPFEKRFTISGENAGLHLLLWEKCGNSERELVEQAGQWGIRVYGLSETFIQKSESTKQGVILLGYGGLSEKEIQAGIAGLKKAWNIS